MSHFYDELSKVWGDRHVRKIVKMNVKTLVDMQQYNVGNNARFKKIKEQKFNFHAN